ncbi:unnamed protein product [Notodromas monacha]|uniref:C2H2-type domain-containing protein n=1 Tax=Notodromas monacha TaxID=399045 RepID=A0A7R9G8Q4_9CRUS|nr:unnamed protein product [Notodromas monacha]CAG0913459.1 unnamed protein product [Notodromas monacha]
MSVRKRTKKLCEICSNSVEIEVTVAPFRAFDDAADVLRHYNIFRQNKNLLNVQLCHQCFSLVKLCDDLSAELSGKVKLLKELKSGMTHHEEDAIYSLNGSDPFLKVIQLGHEPEVKSSIPSHTNDDIIQDRLSTPIRKTSHKFPVSSSDKSRKRSQAAFESQKSFPIISTVHHFFAESENDLKETPMEILGDQKRSPVLLARVPNYERKSTEPDQLESVISILEEYENLLGKGYGYSPGEDSRLETDNKEKELADDVLIEETDEEDVEEIEEEDHDDVMESDEDFNTPGKKKGPVVRWSKDDPGCKNPRPCVKFVEDSADAYLVDDYVFEARKIPLCPEYLVFVQCKGEKGPPVEDRGSKKPVKCGVLGVVNLNEKCFYYSFHESKESHKHKSRVEETKRRMAMQDAKKKNLWRAGPRTKPFVCDLCPYQTQAKYALYMHYARIHKIPNAKRCFECGRFFAQETEYEKHMAMHLEEYRDTVSCLTCRKVKSANRSFRRHMRNAHGNKVCWTHEERRAAGISLFICGLCKFFTSAMDDFNLHRFAEHFGKKSVKCDECDTLVCGMRALRDHKNVKHSAACLYECVDCHMTFKTRQSFGWHRVTHKAKPEETVCSFCGLLFSTIKMREHMHTFHPEQIVDQNLIVMPQVVFECRVCEEVLPTRKDLHAHQEEKHGKVKPHYPRLRRPETVECAYCGTTLRQAAYTRHRIRVHGVAFIGEDVFPCTGCSQKFERLRFLKVHQKEVHGWHYECQVDSGIQCKICHEAIRVRREFVRHLKKQHRVLGITNKTFMQYVAVPEGAVELVPVKSAGRKSGAAVKDEEEKEPLIV